MVWSPKFATTRLPAELKVIPRGVERFVVANVDETPWGVNLTIAFQDAA
jgi:hypothetical protein